MTVTSTVTKGATKQAKRPASRASSQPSASKKSEPGSAKTGPETSASSKQSAQAKAGDVDRNVPRSWQEIRPGSLVLAQSSAEEGWWEAVVTAINNEVVTLRWRDYATQPVINRARAQVGFFAAEK